MKKTTLIIFYCLSIFLVFVSCKFFREETVDDSKCTVDDIEQANSVIYPLISKLRVYLFYLLLLLIS